LSNAERVDSTEKGRIMKIVSIKVQIPDGWELACDEMRPPKKDEWYCFGNGDEPNRARNDFESEWVNVRKVEPWKQPEFLKPGWIAMDADGEWYWTGGEPRQCGDDWNAEGGSIYLAFTNWTPPTCTDWKQSKRRIE